MDLPRGDVGRADQRPRRRRRRDLLPAPHPLQTVDARQQTERGPSKPALNDGVVRQLCLVVKNEGWERLYGGTVARRHPASQVVYYYFYQILRRSAEAASLRRSIRGIGSGSIGMLQSLTVAALSGCVNVLLKKANKQQNPKDQGLTSGLEKALQTALVENIPHKTINVMFFIGLCVSYIYCLVMRCTMASPTCLKTANEEGCSTRPSMPTDTSGKLFMNHGRCRYMRKERWTRESPLQFFLSTFHCLGLI